MPNLPFPNLNIQTQGNLAIVKLKNEELANMLKKAIENNGQKVKSVEVYPDVFVVILDLSDLEQRIKSQGLPATIEPKEIKITIDRKELIESFKRVGKLDEKGITVVDKADYVELRGVITNIPSVNM